MSWGYSNVQIDHWHWLAFNFHCFCQNYIRLSKLFAAILKFSLNYPLTARTKSSSNVGHMIVCFSSIIYTEITLTCTPLQYKSLLNPTSLYWFQLDHEHLLLCWCHQFLRGFEEEGANGDKGTMDRNPRQGIKTFMIPFQWDGGEKQFLHAVLLQDLGEGLKGELGGNASNMGNHLEGRYMVLLFWGGRFFFARFPGF